jgi:hypothetical protein
MRQEVAMRTLPGLAFRMIPFFVLFSGCNNNGSITAKLDGSGNLTVDNALCEGIGSGALPATAPQF